MARTLFVVVKMCSLRDRIKTLISLISKLKCTGILGISILTIRSSTKGFFNLLELLNYTQYVHFYMTRFFHCVYTTSN